MISVSESTVTVVAGVVPKSTAVAPVKSVPVMVTVVPPAVGPALGLTAVTVGARDVGELVGGRVARCRPGGDRHVDGAACRPGRWR